MNHLLRGPLNWLGRFDGGDARIAESRQIRLGFCCMGLNSAQAKSITKHRGARTEADDGQDLQVHEVVRAKDDNRKDRWYRAATLNQFVIAEIQSLVDNADADWRNESAGSVVVIGASGVVAGAGLDFVILFVLDFDLAVSAVLLGIGWRVSDVVLAA